MSNLNITPLNSLINLLNQNPELEKFLENDLVKIESFLKEIFQSELDSSNNYHLHFPHTKVTIPISSETVLKVSQLFAQMFVKNMLNEENFIYFVINQLDLSSLKQLLSLEKSGRENVITAFDRLYLKHNPYITTFNKLILLAQKNSSLPELIDAFYDSEYLPCLKQKEAYKTAFDLLNDEELKLPLMQFFKDIQNESDLEKLIFLINNLRQDQKKLKSNILCLNSFFKDAKQFNNQKANFILYFFENYHENSWLILNLMLSLHSEIDYDYNHYDLFIFLHQPDAKSIIQKFIPHTSNDDEIFRFLILYKLSQQKKRNKPESISKFDKLLSQINESNRCQFLYFFATHSICSEKIFEQLFNFIEDVTDHNLLIQLFTILISIEVVDHSYKAIVHSVLDQMKTIKGENYKTYFIDILDSIIIQGDTFDDIEQLNQKIQQARDVYDCSFYLADTENHLLMFSILKILNLEKVNFLFIKYPKNLMKQLNRLLETISQPTDKIYFCQFLYFFILADKINNKTYSDFTQAIEKCHKQYSLILEKKDQDAEYTYKFIYLLVQDFNLDLPLDQIILEMLTAIYQTPSQDWEMMNKSLAIFFHNNMIFKKYITPIFCRAFQAKQFINFNHYLKVITPIFDGLTKELVDNETFLLNYYINFCTFIDKKSIEEINQISLLNPYFEKPEYLAYRLELMTLMNILSFKQREFFFNAAGEVLFKHVNGPTHIKYLNFMVFLRPNSMTKMLGLIQEKKLDVQEILYQTVAQDKIEIYNYISDYFNSYHEPYIHISFINKFFIIQNLLQLSDQDPLVQTAILLYTKQLNINNPSEFYINLKEIVKHEALISFKHVPIQKIGTQPFSWNLEFLREVKYKKVFKKDIPPQAFKQTFTPVFELFSQRLEQLSINEQEQVNTCIQTWFMTKENEPIIKWQDLKSFFIYSSVINSLFLREDQYNEPLTGSQVHLYGILHALSEASSTLEKNELLTEQETFLFKLIAAIRNCNNGQLNGLKDFYYTLPLKHQLSVAFQNNKELKVHSFVGDIIQKSMHEVFNHSKFLQELGCKTQDFVHDLQYLQNRYHKQIGLHHELIFDLYISNISKSLLSLDTQRFLETFFQFFLIEEVINQIVRHAPNLLKEDCYQGFANLLQDHSTSLRECFESDEDEIPFGLTPSGALALLKGTQYIKQISVDPKDNNKI